MSHILFAGRRGFRQILQKTDDSESTFSPLPSHSDSHSIPTASGSAACASRFDVLRLCVFASLRLCVLTASFPTQRRRGAKTQRGLGQDAVDWIGRPRAIAENRTARLLTDEPWTPSDWSERGWTVEASVNCHVPRGSCPSLASVVIREIRVIHGQPLCWRHPTTSLTKCLAQ